MEMTPDQIKALAKQAGGTTHTTMGDRLTIFLPDALTEFVRLVRESAFEEAARQFGPNNGAWPVNAITQTIRNLK